jgi:hypothetical protein
MPDLPCRVAKLEENLKNVSDDSKEFRESITVSLKEIAETLQEMQVERSKQIGYIGGISTAVGGIAAIATFVINKYF